MGNYQAIIKMKNGDIIHYGVTGMKWGQRKYAKAHGGSTQGYVYQSRQTKSAKKSYNKTADKEKRKGRVEQSNRARNKRLLAQAYQLRDKNFQKSKHPLMKSISDHTPGGAIGGALEGYIMYKNLRDARYRGDKNKMNRHRKY